MNDVGILTFHCSDNYGAMLQAYGLKEYLKQRNVKVEIVRYEPPYMTGRHWWIPYVPLGNVFSTLWYGWYKWKRNREKGKAFFVRRANMKHFRSNYLIGREQKKRWLSCHLNSLPYSYYIVGSDQIWNPEVTCGLKSVYFGAFRGNNKKRVIAYAASLGGVSLSSRYDQKFSKLIKHVDAISVREEGAIPYIKQFYAGNVQMVPDPVFLLSKKTWEKIEQLPEKEHYIVVYITEKNEELTAYVKELSKKQGIEIIQIASDIDLTYEEFDQIYTAGPSEFLGYIHKADYVITNSFHATAFSIIFEKKFIVFQHCSAGERIRNILKTYGLENRLYQQNKNIEIDAVVDWDKVRKQGEESRRAGENFLKNHLNGFR